MKPNWNRRAMLALVPLGSWACADAPSDEGLVARAGPFELRVDEAVELLVDHETLPNQAEVVEALANLWIDYTLFGSAAARDSTLASVDVEGLARQQLDQRAILQLRDSMVQVDTAVTEVELRRLYEAESTEAEVRARHILMGYPQAATEAQRDSVHAEMEAVREAVVAGASFEETARRLSQDRGSARNGGDLGFFRRGDMVRPFEEASFALAPGELSEIVESPFGLHLIRLEERRVPDFDAVRDRFRAEVRERRSAAAESTFVAGLEERSGPRFTDDALAVLRELAADPGRRLSGRAARRPLARFQGGEYTAGELLDLLRTRPAPERARMAEATDEQLDDFLRGLVQREILLAEARRAGLGPSRAEADSLAEQVREQLRQVARRTGVLGPERAPGEPLAPALERAVSRALRDVLTGAANPVSLGPIAFQLRERASASILDAGVGQVVLGVAQARAARRPSPLEEALPSDSGGGSAGRW